MKIGFFDSGIGGLSVLHTAMKEIPNAEFVYYADRENVPYGEKTTGQIRGFCEEILRFLIAQDVDAIVIACNTATSVADRAFRLQFPVPIIGMEPAVKVALEQVSPNRRVLVIATPITIAGKKLQALVETYDRNGQCDLAELPRLVRFAERGVFEDREVDEYLAEQLKPFPLEKEEYVVLGCTHFNYFKTGIRKLMPGIRFADGNAGTIRQLKRKLTELESHHDGIPGKVTFYFSGREAGEAERGQISRCLARLDEMIQIS